MEAGDAAGFEVFNSEISLVTLSLISVSGIFSFIKSYSIDVFSILSYIVLFILLVNIN